MKRELNLLAPCFIPKHAMKSAVSSSIVSASTGNILQSYHFALVYQLNETALMALEHFLDSEMGPEPTKEDIQRTQETVEDVFKLIESPMKSQCAVCLSQVPKSRALKRTRFMIL